jgi:hypothetical protein
MGMKDTRQNDAVDELVGRSADHPELRAFHALHKAHPEVLDFLVHEIRRLRECGWTAFSYSSLFQYARWKIVMARGPGDTFAMNDHASPFYARAITILHPEFNGMCEFRMSTADGIFGTEIEPLRGKRDKNYARRLRWRGGVAIERGWRPTIAHVASHQPHTKPTVHLASASAT